MNSNDSAGQIPQSVNADFSKPVAVDSATLPWLASPQPGVARRLLDRIGGEVARATSIVRYSKDSVFPMHEHGAGEEFLVLDGVFCDENGEYKAGTYVRNPPGSRHAPFTREGCIIFVKLRQMQPQGEPHVVVDTAEESWQTGIAPGHFARPLFSSEHEVVAIERLDAGASHACQSEGGEEILILSGSLDEQQRRYRAGTWLRYPPGYQRRLTSDSGAEFWVKRGHLPA